MNLKRIRNISLILILKFSTIAVFLGRAYQHIFWDAPYRAFFWDQGLLKGFVESVFNVTWSNYVTNLTVSNSIAIFIEIIGVFYLICAIVIFYIKPNQKKLGRFFLIGGGLGLFILALLYSKEKFLHVGQFFEYTAQFMSPILLYLLMFTDICVKRLRIVAVITIALTFACHGLYAFGYYPRPGPFITMTLNILPISEPTAHIFLKVAGILDFVVAIAIFIPIVSNVALWYALFWGALTALARLFGNLYIDFLWSSLNQWTWEVFVRLPHFLIPLLAIVICKKTKYLNNTVSIKNKI